MDWTAVCIAVRAEEHHEPVEKYMTWLQRCGLFPATAHLLVVDDAAADVGSAGSALNALLVTMEHLCAQRGLSVLSEDVLRDSAVLIIQIGSPLGAALSFPGESSLISSSPSLPCILPHSPLVDIVRSVSEIAKAALTECCGGVWVAGTDGQWRGELNSGQFSSPLDPAAITVFTAVVDNELATNHGTYDIDEKGFVRSISYNSAVTHSNHLVIGLLFLPPSFAGSFLSLHAVQPLLRCTYHGEDSGSIGLKLSMFFDVVAATCTADRREFLDAGLAPPTKTERHEELRRAARAAIHQRFERVRTKAVTLRIDGYKYSSGGESCTSLPGIRISDHFEGMINVFMDCLLRRLALALSLASNGEPLLPILRCLLAVRREATLEQCIDCCRRAAKGHNGSMLTAARALSTVGEALWLASERRGGLRCGPAANQSFRRAMRLLEKTSTEEEGMDALFDELRNNWLATPQRMVRAERHFEAAAQIFIRRRVVDVCRRLLPTRDRDATATRAKRQRVRARVASRVDLFGGWLDTPPITFDVAKAAVLNMAIMVNGQYPIECVIDVLSEDVLVIELEEQHQQLRLDGHDIWERHDKPSMPGSLACACMVGAGVLLDESALLPCGLHLRCHSIFPQGSGLGSSSILAAAIIAAIWTLFDVPHTRQQIVHAVLYVEQLLTTGGGWQDQVGGIYPGIKLGRFDNVTQRVEVDEIAASDEMKAAISRRLVLVFTGQPRLAKNLLQEVVRDWLAREGEKSRVIHAMSDRVEEAAKTIGQGVWPSEDVAFYYAVKKTLATGCEPDEVTRIIQTLSPAAEVCWLAGAGGGGYLCVWLRADATSEHAQKLLRDSGFDHLRVDRVAIATEALLVD